MARIAELINILDCEDEPLPKRLKLANCAFNSTIPIHFKEITLLKWLMGLAKTGDNEIFEKINEWLHSEEITNISKTDVLKENVFEILKIITMMISCEDNGDFEPVIIESFLQVISNKTFQQYFKHDLKAYFKCVSQLLEQVKDLSLLLNVLESEALFNKLYFTEPKSYKYFCKICLPTLGQITMNAESDIKISIIRLVHKIVFYKHAKQFENYMTMIFEHNNSDEEFNIPKILVKAICDHYNSRNSSVIYLVYSSFCFAFESKFRVVYQFTSLLFQICGIDMKEKFNFIFDYDDCDYDINFSLTVINDVYSVLTTVKTNVDDKINTINFPSTSQSLLLTIMANSTASKSVMKILTNAINAEPLILEPMLTAILPYIIYSRTSDNEEYDILLMTIFTVSAKLYRLSNLITKLLKSTKNYPTEANTMEGIFKFKGNQNKVSVLRDSSIELILTQQILDCFSKHILDLASWQVINIFKTFSFHLKEIYEDLNNMAAEELNHTYVEMLCTLFCTFLSSVRVIEHTTPDLVVNKFVKCMLELRSTLQALGNRLLELNHNQYIMRAYLNICYAWGELWILLNFYSSASDVVNLRSNNNDYQVCCTSYVHSYLTAEQWCSIIERITNFGEKPCKCVLQSLQVQGIKAIFLFENGKVDIGVLFLRNFTQNPSLRSLLADRFVIKKMVPKLQPNIVSALAKEFIEEALQEENSKIFQGGALESSELVLEIVLNILIKLIKNNKNKHKEKGMTDAKELLTTLFHVEVDDIICHSSQYYSEFKAYFKGQNISEPKIKDYVMLLRKLPVMSLSNNALVIAFLQFAALLEHVTVQEMNIKLQVEEVVIGIIQFRSEILSNLQAKFIVPFILNNITNYKPVFLYWLENMLRNPGNFVLNFQNLVRYLSKEFHNDNKTRMCVIILLSFLNKKIKKSKVYVKLKSEIDEQRDKIYKLIVKWLSSSPESMKEVFHFYALTLRHCLFVGSDQKNDLEKDLLKYINIAVVDPNQSNTEASLLLFSTVLSHKKQLGVVSDEVILNIWKTIQTYRIESELKNEYFRLMVLVCQHVSNEHFETVYGNLTNVVRSLIKDNNSKGFAEAMVSINGILQCSFNPIKIKIWQSNVEVMLSEMVSSLANNLDKSFGEQVLNFEINVIQANRFILTALMIDEIFRTISLLFKKSSEEILEVFKPSVQILNLLLKQRMPLMSDRLPSFFQTYRILLSHLCKVSDSSLHLSTTAIQTLADCAHQLEKLTKVVVTYGIHIQRIIPYLVADILQQYENVPMYSSVKIHIDNCIYTLMSMFDQHAISFLMRSLSTASTELFKYMHSNFRRYYRFTGKV